MCIFYPSDYNQLKAMIMTLKHRYVLTYTSRHVMLTWILGASTKTWTPNHLTFTSMPFNFSSTANALLDWINHGHWQYTKVAVTKPLPHYIVKGHIGNLTQMLTKLDTCNSYIFDSVFIMDISIDRTTLIVKFSSFMIKLFVVYQDKIRM